MKTFLKTTGWLVMAAALSFGISACSSDDDVVKQPQNPTEPQVYTLVVKASKGDISTRALKEPGASGIDAYWSGEETIEVGQYNYTTEQYDIIGTATAVPSETGETTITAELTSAPNPDYDLNFFLGGSTPDYTGQVGLLTGTGSISEKYDYASDCLTSGSYTVDNTNNKIIPGDYEPLEFGAAQQAIIKFTLQDKGNENAAISPSALTVSDGTSTVDLTDIPASTYTANGAGVLYVAFPPGAENTTITLTATVGEDTYTYTTSSAKTFYRGQYYPITVKMTKVPPTLAATMTTAGMTVKVNYNYFDEENYCLFLSNGDGTYTFQSGDGYAGGDADWAKALVVEDGKLVFKQNDDEPIDYDWGRHGFSVTFNTSDDSYTEWVGGTAKEQWNPSFISVEVNGTTISLSEQQSKITVDDIVKAIYDSWSDIVKDNSDKIYIDGDNIKRSSDGAKLLQNDHSGAGWVETHTGDAYIPTTSYKFEGDS